MFHCRRFFLLGLSLICTLTTTQTWAMSTAELDALLPAEPQMPKQVCHTLRAQLSYVNWRLPADIDQDPANSNPDGQRIQQALNTCGKGQAVKLVTDKNNNAFLAGPIQLPSGVTLWVDKQVRLFASRSPRDYDLGDGVCGNALPKIKNRCKPWIYAKNTHNSGIVGEGVIDGRGGAILTSGKLAFKATWWDLSMQSKAKPKLEQNNPRMMQIDDSSQFTLYKITIQNGAKFHFKSKNVDGLTAWGIKLLTPSLAYSKPGYQCPKDELPKPGKLDKPSTCFIPELVKNTDGFDPGTSKNVTLAYSYISTGDDNVAIKSGKATNRPATQNHLYAHNQFYYGHGMSIGSETDAGVDNIKVWNLTLDGMDSSHGVGIRIKSDGKRGGLINNVYYKNVCMRRAKDALVFTPYYSSTKTNKLPPKMTNIVLEDFYYSDYPNAKYNKPLVNFAGYHTVKNGQAITYPLDITLNNVVFESKAKIRDNKHFHHHHINYKIGEQGIVNFPLRKQDDISINRLPAKAAQPVDCNGRYQPFPSPDSPI
ncbi:polygalacturonase (plasmid) [Saccharobesus litoralis]|uniref:Polygalacturonase n=1 Tax=Saccharobesus litoralis TaxID=2172099 RepID=A0A2S0VYI4_9ALTE|nr:glycosyl hydrolase family 28 protein [Saccharobesus litoralis]AWB69242.1 polygalacturonase [Saccharobesus litoralis]